MGMVTPGELAWMRAAQNRRFDLTATITRSTNSSDGAGGGTSGAPTSFTSPCCRHPRKSATGEELASGAIQPTGLWDVTFPAGTDIRAKDTIAIDGKKYSVFSVAGPKSRETAVVVLCMEQ